MVEKKKFFKKIMIEFKSLGKKEHVFNLSKVLYHRKHDLCTCKAAKVRADVHILRMVDRLVIWQGHYSNAVFFSK